MKKAILAAPLVLATLMLCTVMTPVAGDSSKVCGVVRDMEGGERIGTGWFVATQNGTGLAGKLTFPGEPYFQGPQTWTIHVDYYADLPYMVVWMVDGPIEFIYHGTASRRGDGLKLPCIVEATLYTLPNGAAAVGRNANVTIGDDRVVGLQPFYQLFFDGNSQP